MDPMSAGSEEHGRHEDRRPAGLPARRPPRRETITPALAAPAPGTAGAPARTTELVAGDFLITVNPVDGSEIEPCPPGRAPGRPARRTARDRAALQRAGRPSAPPGPAAVPLPLLEREAEHDQLVDLLGRGRSVRVLGAPGSGRTVLLDAVAARCGTLAPDGLIRLSGHRRGAAELLQDLYTAVFRTEPGHRPGRAELRAAVSEVGAVVVVDDLEIGGEALDDLLTSTPECAFLFAVAPDVPAPSPAAAVADVLLAGLSRPASLELLERAAGRPLAEAEKNWAGDLWFESEGLPLRFVQAGALLRQRDRLRRDPEASDEFAAFEKPAAAGPAAPSAFDPALGAADEDGAHDIPLPSLGEGAAPAALLASRLSESARATLRFAVALGGEVPHQAHLPALVGDTHADAALGELTSCALLSPVGSRYRLAPGTVTQLEAAGYADDAVWHARTAAEHYAWWTGHPSVTPERVAAEAEAVLASMAPLPSDEAAAAVRLARSAAPAFLAGLRWSAWEKALRAGQSAARTAGEVAEEAYFHHELGILALCAGNLDRARAELEASIGMRGVVADRSGTVAGRRALALVSDLENGVTPAGRAAAPAASAAPAHESGPSPIVAALPSRSVDPTARQDPVVIAQSARPAPVRRILGGAKRNMVAAGAAAVLAAVMGTVVGLGLSSGDGSQGTDHTATERTDQDGGGDGLPPQEPAAPDSAPAGAQAPAGSGTPRHASPSGTGSSSASGAASSTGAGASDDGTSPSATGGGGHNGGSPSHSHPGGGSSSGGSGGSGSSGGSGGSGGDGGTGGSGGSGGGDGGSGGSGGSSGGGSTTPTDPPSSDDPTDPPTSGGPTSPPPSDPSSPAGGDDGGSGGGAAAQSASVTPSQPAG
ncbi:ATP-binding protein [Streptomyces sp. NPDC047002]|uniref:ATP-binding protein n=1 Tax=Streptomyces sp. NPDC047002 TaxID=3155475 RepID=UPI0034534714